MLGAVTVLLLAWAVFAVPVPQAADPAARPTAAALTDAEMEAFLLEGRVVKTRAAGGGGKTGALRATLEHGGLRHDALVQTIDEEKPFLDMNRGRELDFRDSYRNNAAAYRLDRLLGLGMVPVTVVRIFDGKKAGFTWWVDDVLMDEKARLDKKVQPPNPVVWVETMQLVRIFDQLIYNVDRNMGNLLITKDWRIWAIDHTRAFRLQKTISKPEHIARCDRGVLEGLKRLDKAVLERELGEYLTGWERDALLARRDEIVKIIEKAGEVGLFDRRRS